MEILYPPIAPTYRNTSMTIANSAAVNAANLQADIDAIGGVFTVTGTAWAATTNASTTITVTLTNHGGVTGDTVYINGVTGGPYNNIPATALGSLGRGGGLNGGHTITVVDANTFTFVSTSTANATGSITPTGTITITMGNRGGIVYIPAGEYSVAADTLVYRSGVIVEGVIPKLTFNTAQPDLVFAMSGGTILSGSGTGTFISYTGLDTGATTFAQTALSNCGFRKMGIKNYANFSVTGGTTLNGVSWHYLEDLYFTDISGTVITDINGQHEVYNRIFGYVAGNGLVMRSDITRTTYGSPGNTNLTDIYFGISGFTSCPFSFEAKAASGTGQLNEITATRLQGNAFNRTQVTATTTWANGTANIVITGFTGGGTIASFPVDMPIMFTGTPPASANTTGVYFVVSNNGTDTITVSNRLRGTAISNATGALTPGLVTNGMNQYRFMGYNTAGTDIISNFIFTACDAEGPSTAAIVVQDATLCSLTFTAVGDITNTLRNLVARNSTLTEFVGLNTTYRDFDTTSSSITGIRFRGQTKGDDIGVTGGARPAHGMYYDSVNLQSNLRLGPTGALTFGGNNMLRAEKSCLAQTNYNRTSTLASDATHAGNVVLSGSSTGQTWTLPTIVNAAIGTSNVGVTYSFVNVDTAASNGGSWTISSNNSELFNGVTGRTSMILPVGASVKLTAVATQTTPTTGGTLYWMVSGFTTPPTSMFPTISQATSKTTAVTLNERCARITMFNTLMAGGATATFQWNSTAILVGDKVSAWVGSGAASRPSYAVQVLDVEAGIVSIRVTNITGGNLSENIVINVACDNW